MDIKLRARRFCSLLRVNKRTRYNISTFLESLSDHQICIDPIADKEWLWLTDACCDPLTYMNAPSASLSIRDDAKVKIAPVHSDCKCSFWLRSLMGSAG